MPLTDEKAPFGTELVPLVRTVIRLMNGFEGFGGRDIELVVRDEGSTPESARQAASGLITTDRVDAVIGPFSSVNAPSVVPAFVSSGIGVCSPSVSSQLMEFLNDNGLFFRTTAIDSAILRNMVDLAVKSGSKRVSLAYPDDPYGRALAREMQDYLDDRELEVISTISYQVAADNYRDDAVLMTSDEVPLELIIGDPNDGPRFLNAVVAESRDSVIITNDGLIDATVVYNPDVTSSQRPRVFGVTSDVNNGNSELLNVLSFADPKFDNSTTSLPAFSVNTIHCVMLIWLAALTAESDNALIFKDQMTEVANEGSICFWIADCKLSVDGKLNLDFEGIGGFAIDDAGNAVGRSTITVLFDDEGRAQLVQGAPNVTLSS